MKSFFWTINKKKFVFRIVFFLSTFFLACYDSTLLENIFFLNLAHSIQVYHLLWVLFLLELLLFLIPYFSSYLGCGRLFARNNKATDYNEQILQLYTKKTNRRALKALAIWLIVLSAIGYAYLNGFITTTMVFIIVIFFYFADQFCINVWCPFRAWIVRNKCCNACRIYNWGQCMYISPLIFVPSFWTYSLALASLAILIQWEYQHYRYPERFSEISNLALRCSNCKFICKKYSSNTIISHKIEMTP